MLKKDRNIGLYCSLIGILFYIFINIYVVFNLPKVLDTFVVFSWVCLPGIAAGIIFQFMDKKNMWDDGFIS